MAEAGDREQSAYPGYVIAQLRRAMSAVLSHADPDVRRRAGARLAQWEGVLQGMLDGSISAGSRTPVQAVPAWVTVQVAQGGFATGELVAAGPLQPHEVERLAALGREADGSGRAALNLYFLSEPGRRELREMLGSGCYRIRVPEEGALLVVAWLLSNGMEESAGGVIDQIAPFFDRLRFFPVPDSRPMPSTAAVRRQDVGEAVDALERRRPQAQVARMVEALRIWQPMYGRAVAMFVETVDENWPCRKFPAGWQSRARDFLDEYAALRKAHSLCGKPDRPKENFARLRVYMRICADNPAGLTGREVGAIRRILRSYEARHAVGRPGDEVAPTYDELNQVLISRLKRFPREGGLESLTVADSPVTGEEAARFGISEGAAIPRPLLSKALRCLEGSLEELAALGIVPSSEVLAQLLPAVTAQVQAAGYADPDLARLYCAIYAAFRRRRSLLLYYLASQVRIEELPWVAAMESQRSGDERTRAAARETLEQAGDLALASFPQTVFPNKLLKEFQALVHTSGAPIPIVDELAADIFMGVFGAKFLRAAQIAARVLRGSLYERYYGLPYESVQAMHPAPKETPSKETQWIAPPEFTALCRELAGPAVKEGWSVARNGQIIEQAQILTTHNLATLFDESGLRRRLAGRLPELARRCFRWICRRQSCDRSSRRANLHNIKNCAYAWRQLIFFLSVAGDQEAAGFLTWAREHLGKQRAVTRERLQPAMDGLEWVAAGGSFDTKGESPGRRILGWTAGRVEV
jgi:hypothetical protein